MLSRESSGVVFESHWIGTELPGDDQLLGNYARQQLVCVSAGAENNAKQTAPGEVLGFASSDGSSILPISTIKTLILIQKFGRGSEAYWVLFRFLYGGQLG